MGAGSGVLLTPLSGPFAPTLNRGLLLSHRLSLIAFPDFLQRNILPDLDWWTRQNRKLNCSRNWSDESANALG